jgi:hypothetical protein
MPAARPRTHVGGEISSSNVATTGAPHGGSTQRSTVVSSRMPESDEAAPFASEPSRRVRKRRGSTIDVDPLEPTLDQGHARVVARAIIHEIEVAKIERDA